VEGAKAFNSQSWGGGKGYGVFLRQDLGKFHRVKKFGGNREDDYLLGHGGVLEQINGHAKEGLGRVWGNRETGKKWGGKTS